MDAQTMTAWLVEGAKALLAGLTGPPDLGRIEVAVEQAARLLSRGAVERLAQEAVGAMPFTCPDCRGPLRVIEHDRERTVTCSSGPIRLSRSYGRCPACGTNVCPADAALGLSERAAASPRVQEFCALATLRAPAGRAEEDVRRLTGLRIPASTLHREARRQGERALEQRQADERLTRTPAGVAELASRAKVPDGDFTLVIEIDAWNIRERDNWGQTQELLKAGQDTGRWHWVLTATVFRLDQRGTTLSGRPVISERGYVGTRAGLESFQAQVYAEALMRGLMRAKTVLLLGDGAAWIWNLAENRFPSAVQRLDLYHAQEYLWGLAHELHGRGTPEARAWVGPYLRDLREAENGAGKLVEGLTGLAGVMEGLTQGQLQSVAREAEYFRTHQGRMDYKAGLARGEPVGSGAIESTCSQCQRRFKRTGQFWSLAGDEAFLALWTLHQNGRWQLLFPHDTRDWLDKVA